MESVQKVNEETAQVKMAHLIGKNNEIETYNYTQNIYLWREADYLQGIENSGFKVIKRLVERDFRMGAFVCKK